MMMNRMFQILSFTDIFLLVLSVQYKYVLVQQGKNWNDAQAYCKANFIDSAIANASDYIVKLQNEAQKQRFNSSAWIGLYNDMNFRWSLGNQPLGAVTDWCTGKPSYTMHDCVALNQGGWFDVPCFHTYPFVCFDAKYTDSGKFIVISTNMTFQDAQTYCRTHHTDLATVTTLEESTIIKQKVSGNSWFGLFRDVWKWTDQRKLSGWPWGVNPWGVPVNYICGSFINGKINPAPCDTIMPFFCLRDFTKKQTIRITVKSDQNMNDAAVKAEILQKIKKKLEEHGLSYNTTIKWREKPDGVVFKRIEENTKNVTEEKCDTNNFDFIF